MSHPDIEAAILINLYNACFTEEGISNMRELRETGGWGDVPFWNSVDRMKHEGLIAAVTMAGCKITYRGILHAEEHGLAPRAIMNDNNRARTGILNALADRYEQKGRGASGHFQTISKEISCDEKSVLANIRFMTDAGLLEKASMGSSRITHRGLETIEDWRKRKAMGDEFEEISKLSPQPRGRALQKLLAQIFEQNGWGQEEGVKTSNEEMDIIVFHAREYYLVECKWEKDPIGAAVVRELSGKLTNRVDVRGIVISMSGFTSGAVKQAEDYVGQQIMLLFGPDDTRAMIDHTVSFDDLLDAKYKELVTKRKIIFS